MQRRMPAIAVVGSLNMDLVTTTVRRPQRGETLIGTSFATFVGGKGLNQAIACARLGAQTRMVGRVGRDDFGKKLLQTLHHEQIDSQFITRDPQAGTGIATIVIDGAGDNSIIIVPGANGRLSIADIERASGVLGNADVLVLQLEVPLDVVLRAARMAHDLGVQVLLNPAPARPLPDELLALVDVLLPNETETEALTGISVADDQSAARAAQVLLERGVKTVVLTLGARGALLAEGQQTIRIPGYAVSVVDTTAAGDAFCGALAVQLAQGQSMARAIRYANAAGALATTVLGAEPALPTRVALEQFLAAQPGR